MSLHKLTAGSGYDYLTRQVAAQDVTERGHLGLASYYAAQGEAPGVWVGRGMAGLHGLTAGDTVTEEQMRALFGSGRHPLAEQLRTAAADAGMDILAQERATWLGKPYAVYADDVSPFRREVAARVAELNVQQGLPADATGSLDDRARIRTEVAVELFRREYGRDPADAREVAATIAKHSRPRTTAVAGYDLTFSPVKSVSTLWAVADTSVAAAIERAHQQAVQDALTWIEGHALFTREGTAGVRQVETRGLVAAAFTHRDSRAGDPDLHTHVAVANKVQTLDGGRWLAIDGRLMFKAAVAASETYNTRLEHHLREALGVRFQARPSTDSHDTRIDAKADPRKRPVREIVGVDPALNVRWSARRASIETRRAVLVKDFQTTHGRPPTPVESIKLAQQATLETRDAKHAPRSLSQQRAEWAAQAADALGDRDAVARMVATALSPPGLTDQRPGRDHHGVVIDRAWLSETGSGITTALQERRSHWQRWHVHAEALRRVRGAHLRTTDIDRVVDLLVEEVLTRHCVALTRPADEMDPGTYPPMADAVGRHRNNKPDTHDPSTTLKDVLNDVVSRSAAAWRGNQLDKQVAAGVVVPAGLQRRDGSSVYSVAGAPLFTSPDLLAAEARIVARAGQRDGARASSGAVDAALASCAADGVPLNAGQAAMVRQMATSGARVQLAIAPAGAGKTTAMLALAQAWANAFPGAGTVVGLAPSAAAAAVLGEHLDAAGSTEHAGRVATDTMAKLLWHLEHPDAGDTPAWVESIGPSTLVVIDEAGMSDTLSLDRVVEHAVTRGASVRLVGDDQQLAAVGAGGVLRDIQAGRGTDSSDTGGGCLNLSELMRFTDPAEGAASLALREGLPEALGFYLDPTRDRVHIGDLATMTDDVFTAWCHDRAAGQDAIMLAPTRDLVSELNQRARRHRLDGHPPTPPPKAHDERTAPTDTAADPARTNNTRGEVRLADGNMASVGDLIITRTNDRSLRVTATDWVKNGDRWQVTALARGRGLRVRHVTSGRSVDLPPAYVAASVELGYASTIHTAQGVTADTSHTLLTGNESRQLVYTALTRGRRSNRVYLEAVGDGDEHNAIRPDHTHPPTASDLLEQVLARDDSPRSATTVRRDDQDPRHLLGPAAARYVDSLHHAAERWLESREVHHAADPGNEGGPVDRLDRAADTVVADLTTQPAWPTLRAHLLLRAAHGLDPVQELRHAVGQRELGTAHDVAAVIDWRLDDTGLRSTGPAGTGPLPWLPAIPNALADDPQWGPYLSARAARVRDLRDQVAHLTIPSTTTPPVGTTFNKDLPAWARQGQARPDDQLLADVAVWRAAQSVPDTDRRPTGAPQQAKAPRRWQTGLDDRLARGRTPALTEWGPTLARSLTHPRRDPFTPLLAQRLAAISRAGIDAPALLRRALQAGLLPDDHNAAALWWRIAGHLSPAVAAQASSDHPVDTPWTARLTDAVGPHRAGQLRESPWWPALVTVVDQSLTRGTQLPHLLTLLGGFPADADDVDPCQAFVWRLSVLNDPPPPDHADQPPPDPMDPGDPGDPATPVDEANPFWDDEPTETSPGAGDEMPPETPDNPGWPHPNHPHHVREPDQEPPDEAACPPDDHDDFEYVDDESVVAALAWAARARAFAGPLEPTDREIDTDLARAYDSDTAAVSFERIQQLNTAASDYYASMLPGSWAQAYLTDRLRTDLTGDPHVRPGYAPAGWTNLVRHLQSLGATPDELLAAGLATTTRDRRLVDRFRDRLVFPITRPSRDRSHEGGRRREGSACARTTSAPAPLQLETLGFVGRRRPGIDDTAGSRAGRHHPAGPKYLNTPDTALFHKGSQLYTVRHDHLDNGATPVLVEGVLDALAVSLAGAGRYVGVAPLGTSLTEQQAGQLARLGRPPAEPGTGTSHGVGHRPAARPIVATDADLAGQVAAQRDYWLLTQHATDPQTVTLRPGSDPADILMHHGKQALAETLDAATPLMFTLLSRQLTTLQGVAASRQAVQVLAAGNPTSWETGIAAISAATGTASPALRRQLAQAVGTWDLDPRVPVREAIADLSAVRQKHRPCTDRRQRRSSAQDAAAGTAEVAERGMSL